MDLVLVGQPGSGKTLLWERLGRLAGAGTGGATPGAPPEVRAWSATRGHGPWRRRVCLVDTPGLTDRVHPDPARRRAQALALERIAAAAGLLHVVDASRAGQQGEEALAGVDQALSLLGARRGGYAVVATKMDLPWAATGLVLVRRCLQPGILVPVSALTGQGLGLLRRLLWRGPWQAVPGAARGHRTSLKA
ncbi:GTPase domain-containing protein [Caldinitratiruptor microaerophilus]|uniref:G domain-containing protein n=1 Tax=Caldinitratiruptor microaerophilus TaxID=671077 RepID=A0AA35G7E1_9FIRM|nr:GTPase domain-containing protein [Caldinitratiruptor microaerophilus]BDG60006.1 hypothetical protein caldi_10960 [Caldinitratiruptor microaerophilus]